MSESSELTRRAFLEMAALIGAGTGTSFAAALSAQDLGLAPEKVTVLRSRNPAGGQWPEVAARALAHPMDAPALRAHNLRGKRIAVMTDDLGASHAGIGGDSARAGRTARRRRRGPADHVRDREGHARPDEDRDLGTPIWINRHVAEADFKVAIGRIAPHEA